MYQIELDMKNEELIQSHNSYRQYTDLYDFAPVGYLTLMNDGTIRSVNQSGMALLGIEHEKSIEQRLEIFVSDASRPAYDDFFAALLSGEGRKTCELEILKNKNDIICVHAEATCFEGGRECRAVLMDITERKKAETALRESEEKYRRLFDNATLGIFQSTPDGKPISVNAAFAHMFGYQSPEDAVTNIKDVGKDLFADPGRRSEILRLLTENPNLRAFENMYRRKDGNTFIGNLNLIPIRDANGALIRTEGIIENITERKQAEDELRRAQEMLTKANIDLQTALARQKQLAHTDSLTGINNRRRLYELAEHEFDIAARYQQPLSVLMFDIDHFKQVNDTFGHAVGDQILQLVTQAAGKELRATDAIGRYGGEEFVIIMPMTSARQAYSLAERIREKVGALRIPTDKGETAVTLSIGIVETHYTRDESAETLIRRADQAMYAAKQSGRNRTEIEKA